VPKWARILFTIGTLALLADPVMAMPVDPTPAAPTVLEGQFISAAYGPLPACGPPHGAAGV